MTLIKRPMIIPLAFLIVLLPYVASGAEIDLRSDTFLHIYQSDQPAGGNAGYAPLYEFLSLGLIDAGNPDLSFHFSGAGRFDLGEEKGTGTKRRVCGAAGRKGKSKEWKVEDVK